MTYVLFCYTLFYCRFLETLPRIFLETLKVLSFDLSDGWAMRTTDVVSPFLVARKREVCSHRTKDFDLTVVETEVHTTKNVYVFLNNICSPFVNKLLLKKSYSFSSTYYPFINFVGWLYLKDRDLHQTCKCSESLSLKGKVLDLFPWNWHTLAVLILGRGQWWWGG